jgi:hypothetical protein
MPIVPLMMVELGKVPIGKANGGQILDAVSGFKSAREAGIFIFSFVVAGIAVYREVEIKRRLGRVL